MRLAVLRCAVLIKNLANEKKMPLRALAMIRDAMGE
jgi:hypothetical protein